MGMEIRQATFVLQSITFIDKLLSGRLIFLGRGGHRTQKGHGLLYDFVKPGRRNNTNKVSLSNVITQTHPKSNFSIASHAQFQCSFKSSVTAILTDN